MLILPGVVCALLRTSYALPGRSCPGSRPCSFMLVPSICGRSLRAAKAGCTREEWLDTWTRLVTVNHSSSSQISSVSPTTCCHPLCRTLTRQQSHAAQEAETVLRAQRIFVLGCRLSPSLDKWLGQLQGFTQRSDH